MGKYKSTNNTRVCVNLDSVISKMYTKKRDMTDLEAAEMRFLRIVTGYTRLDEIRSEIIRK